MSIGSNLGRPKVKFVGVVVNPGDNVDDLIADVQARLDADPTGADAWMFREQIKMLQRMKEPNSGDRNQDK